MNETFRSERIAHTDQRAAKAEVSRAEDKMTLKVGEERAHASRSPGTNRRSRESRVCRARRQGESPELRPFNTQKPVTISGKPGDDAKRYLIQAVQKAIEELKK